MNRITSKRQELCASAVRPRPVRGVHLKELTFKENGKTGDPLWIYSNDKLMDLHHNQALKMTLKTLDGTDYLFIESGGFHEKHGSQ